jgi:hypothetical protein
VSLLIARPLLALGLVAWAIAASAATPAELTRAVVQVVALGAPEFAAKGGTVPLVTLPALAWSGVIGGGRLRAGEFFLGLVW